MSSTDPTGTGSNGTGGRGFWRDLVITGGVAAAVITVLGTLIIGFFTRDRSPEPTRTPTPAVTLTPTETASRSPEPPDTPTPSQTSDQTPSPMADTDQGQQEYSLGDENVTIGGNVYLHGWWQCREPQCRKEFNLYYKCSELSFVAGPTDDNTAPELKIQFTIRARQRELVSFPVDLGDADARKITVRGVFRVRFEVDTITGNGWGGWGEVKAKCEQRPEPA